MIKVLICGDRNWTDARTVRDFVKSLPTGAIIIHGAAKGTDSIAGEEGNKHGYEVRAYPADWERYGRAAGPIRNQQMLDLERPQLVVAFHDNLDSSRGTKDMVQRAKCLGIPVKLCTSKGWSVL